LTIRSDNSTSKTLTIGSNYGFRLTGLFGIGLENIWNGAK
jgi:hypothetical protein